MKNKRKKETDGDFKSISLLLLKVRVRTALFFPDVRGLVTRHVSRSSHETKNVYVYRVQITRMKVWWRLWLHQHQILQVTRKLNHSGEMIQWTLDNS